MKNFITLFFTILVLILFSFSIVEKSSAELMCEPLFSNCSCSYQCTAYSNENELVDCARACSETEIDNSIPTCNLINDSCEEVSTTISSKCKCADGKHYNPKTKKCLSGNEIACTLIYDPVCGCNGVTYANTCTAYANGVKSFSIGECLSSGGLTCVNDADCPIGECPNGSTYNAYSCNNGTCTPILYFRNPCEDLASSSSGGNTTKINKSFSGIWKGKNDQCIVCPLIAIDCLPDYELIPDSCYECAHCEKKSEARVIKNKTEDKKNITLQLCSKNNSLLGKLNIDGLIENGTITSSEIISPSDLYIEITDENGNQNTGTLSLTGKRSLELTLNSNQVISFSFKKYSANGCKEICVNCGNSCCGKNEFCENKQCTPCPIPGCAAPPEGCNYVQEDSIPGKCLSGCGELVCSSSSSGEIDCSSQGSCRGENGEELQCPEGTECSGLPAYGCYLPGCPVPVCLSENSPVNVSTSKLVKIQDIKVGDKVLGHKNKIVEVIQISKTPVKNHKIYKIILEENKILEGSPSHPTLKNKTFEELKIGEKIKGKKIIKKDLLNYSFDFTYDILTSDPSGGYFIDGIPVGSTLKK